MPRDPIKSGANGLTKAVVNFLKYSGWHAERTSNEGRYIEGKTHTDLLGNVQAVSKGRRIRSSGTRGTSDIKATIKGRFIAIEIKWGTDRQSEHQKSYQASVEKSGGEYWIVRTIDDFFEQYESFLKRV